MQVSPRRAPSCPADDALDAVLTRYERSWLHAYDRITDPTHQTSSFADPVAFR
jgi:hypothetical protein